MKTLQKRMRSFLMERMNAVSLFLLGYALVLFAEVWRTTMFPFSPLVKYSILLTAFILFGIKILCFDQYSFKELLFAAALLGCAVPATLHGSSIQPVLWGIVLLAAKEVPVRKLLLTYVLMTVSILLLACSASMLGIIDNLQYVVFNKEGQEQIRNSFGVIYPTDFAAHMFFVSLSIYYLAWKKLRWYHHVLTMILAFIIFQLTIARLDTICMGIMALIFGIVGYAENDHLHKKHGNPAPKRNAMRITGNFLEKAGVFFFPLAAILSFVFSLTFDSSNETLQELNALFSSRLDLGKSGFEKYGCSLFGQNIPMTGNGGSETLPEDYFFIDCSYLYIFLCFGILFFLLVLAASIGICFKFNKDHALLLCMALVALNCIVAHHLIDAAYNPFLLLLFCQKTTAACAAGYRK